MRYEPDFVDYCLRHYHSLAAGRFPQRAAAMRTGRRLLQSQAPTATADTKGDIDRAIRTLPTAEQNAILAYLDAAGSIHAAWKVLRGRRDTLAETIDRGIWLMAVALGWQPAQVEPQTWGEYHALRSGQRRRRRPIDMSQSAA